MTPSTAAFRGVWGVPLVLMRNRRLRPFGGRAGGAPGQVADGPTKGRASVRRTPLLAAQPPGLSQFQQVARKTPNLGAPPYLKPLALSLR